MLEKLFKVKDNATVNLFRNELIPKWDSLYCNVKIQANILSVMVNWLIMGLTRGVGLHAD